MPHCVSQFTIYNKAVTVAGMKKILRQLSRHQYKPQIFKI